MKDIDEVQYILGIKAFQDHKNMRLCYLKPPILTSFGLVCDKIIKKKDCIKTILYASRMGSLIYVMLCTRLDICFMVVQFEHKALDNFQVYTQLSSENERLYIGVSL